MSGDAMRRVAQDLTQQAETLPTRASVAVRKATFETEADAKRNIIAMDAVDTGNLLNSGTTVISNGGLTGHVIFTASYAYWVEGGRTGVPPRPFLGNATDKNAPLFREAMSQLGGDG